MNQKVLLIPELELLHLLPWLESQVEVLE